MKLRILLVAAAAATGAFLGMAAFTWSHRVDVRVADRYSAELRMLLEMSHRLPGDVMRVRSGIVGSYDAAARTAASLERLHRDLSTPPAFLNAEGRREVLSKLEQSERERRNSALDLERFKREYAVLRNSLRFLPVAARSLDKFNADSGEARRVGRAAEGLVRDVLLVQAWHDDEVLGRVNAALAELRAASAAKAIPDDLELVLLHAGVVRDRSPIVDRLTRSIVQGPGAALADEIITAYGLHYQAALDRSSFHRSVLFVLALLMGASAAAYVIARIRSSAEALSRTSRQLERALGELRVEQAKQKELNDLKSRFVSMTSHEFRTPLSVMLSSAEMLSVYGERWAPEKRGDHLERIRASAIAMTKMLDSILLIGKGDAGMLEFRPGPIEVARLCEAVVESTTQSSGKADRVGRSGAGPGDVVVADEALPRHILENLLSNALKYSAPEKLVRFDVKRSDDGIGFVIEDDGIGIPEEDQKRLFETFHRGGNVGKIAGTGLGLSIVKRAVERHGGTVSVTSTPGAGTRCSVHIPSARN